MLALVRPCPGAQLPPDLPQARRRPTFAALPREAIGLVQSGATQSCWLIFGPGPSVGARQNATLVAKLWQSARFRVHTASVLYQPQDLLLC